MFGSLNLIGGYFPTQASSPGEEPQRVREHYHHCDVLGELVEF